MTVAEFIELLKTMPQDLPVTAKDFDPTDGAFWDDQVGVRVVDDAYWYDSQVEEAGMVLTSGPHVRIG